MSETTAFPSTTSASSSSVPMVVITVVGIFAAFALLASYYAFVTKCQLLRPWLSPWRGGVGHGDPSSSPSSTPTLAEERQRRGLGLPLIRMLPVVKFTAAAAEDGRRVSVSSECAVCLCDFAEKERVRLLPGCSHAFHIDCIDTWLQGSVRCPFCRRSVTLPSLPLPMMPPPPMQRPRDVERRDAVSAGSSIVIEVRGEHESWAVGHAGGDSKKVQRKKKAVGDEAVETRTRKVSEELAVEPMRRSLSMDSNLYVSTVVRGYLLDRAELGKSVST